MALLFPTHVKAVCTSLSWFHISSADSNIVLHAYGPLVLAKLDLTVFRDCDLAFVFAFAFAFLIFGIVVFDHAFGSGCCWSRFGSLRTACR